MPKNPPPRVVQKRLKTGPHQNCGIPPIKTDHPDSVAVDHFAAEMKIKLAQKRAEGRGGWDNKEECSKEFLSRLLREHVEKGDPIDVANFCMMLHQRGESIAQIQTSTPQSGIERAARFVEKRRDEYVQDHGSYDPDTGATEFPGDGLEYVAELEEIIDGIRALASQEAAKP